MISTGLALLAAVTLQGHAGHGAPAAPVPAAAHVSMEFDAYAPPHVDVLVGDTVSWTNDSVRAHTVTAADNTWDSDRVARGGAYAHRFDAPGTTPYICRLHVSMRGDVAAHTLLLTAPTQSAAPRRAFPLHGRAALEQGTEVTIEADAGTGEGFTPVGSTTVGADGTFTAVITPTTTATYRAVSGDASSPSVPLIVLDRTITASARTDGERTVISAQVTPASPGGTVVLQLDLHERFGWWPVRQARLDRDSRAQFVLRGSRRVPARVVLTLPDGATRLAVSPTFRTTSVQAPT